MNNFSADISKIFRHLCLWNNSGKHIKTNHLNFIFNATWEGILSKISYFMVECYGLIIGHPWLFHTPGIKFSRIWKSQKNSWKNRGKIFFTFFLHDSYVNLWNNCLSVWLFHICSINMASHLCLCYFWLNIFE